VREVEAVDPLVFDEGQQLRQIVRVLLGHREADADLQAEIATQPNTLQRCLEGPAHLPETVMRGADAVERHPDVVEVAVGDAVNVGRVDEGAIGRQADVEAQRLGAAGDVEDVGPQQWFAAGEDQHRHAKTLQIIHHRKDFFAAQFAREVPVGGDRVAVFAGQVAAPNEVPDHDRRWRIPLRTGWSRCRELLHVL